MKKCPDCGRPNTDSAFSCDCGCLLVTVPGSAQSGAGDPSASSSNKSDELTRRQEGNARGITRKLRLQRTDGSAVPVRPASHSKTNTILGLVGVTIVLRLLLSLMGGRSEQGPDQPSLSQIAGRWEQGPRQPSPSHPAGPREQGSKQPYYGIMEPSSLLAMHDRDLVASVTRSSSGASSYGATGEVMNRGTKTFHFVIVKVEFCDEAGRVVGTLMTEARRDEHFLPGRVRSFAVKGAGKLEYVTARASVAYSVELR